MLWSHVFCTICRSNKVELSGFATYMGDKGEYIYIFENALLESWVKKEIANTKQQNAHYISKLNWKNSQELHTTDAWSPDLSTPNNFWLWYTIPID